MRRIRKTVANVATIALISCTALGQSITPLPEFEVASVKVNQSGETGAYGEKSLASGRFNFPNTRMSELIMWAYKIRIEYITGPSWLNSDRFDVVAKAPSSISLDDARLMLRSLLANRFQLAVRQENKVMPVFALVTGQRDLALTRTTRSDQEHCAPGRGREGEIHVDCTNMTVANLAEYLPDLAPHYIDRPVVDLTGIKGRYDFNLAWAPQSASPQVAAGPTVLDNLEKQFGLKLKQRKQAMPVLVIIHINRVPTDN